MLKNIFTVTKIFALILFLMYGMFFLFYFITGLGVLYGVEHQNTLYSILGISSGITFIITLAKIFRSVENGEKF